MRKVDEVSLLPIPFISLTPISMIKIYLFPLAIIVILLSTNLLAENYSSIPAVQPSIPTITKERTLTNKELQQAFHGTPIFLDRDTKLVMHSTLSIEFGGAVKFSPVSSEPDILTVSHVTRSYYSGHTVYYTTTFTPVSLGESTITISTVSAKGNGNSHFIVNVVDPSTE